MPHRPNRQDRLRREAETAFNPARLAENAAKLQAHLRAMVSEPIKALGKAMQANITGRSVDLSLNGVKGSSLTGGKPINAPRKDTRQVVKPWGFAQQRNAVLVPLTSSNQVIVRTSTKGQKVERFKPFDTRDAEGLHGLGHISDMIGEPGPIQSGKVTVKVLDVSTGKKRKKVLTPRHSFKLQDAPYHPGKRKKD